MAAMAVKRRSGIDASSHGLSQRYRRLGIQRPWRVAPLAGAAPAGVGQASRETHVNAELRMRNSMF